TADARRHLKDLAEFGAHDDATDRAVAELEPFVAAAEETPADQYQSPGCSAPPSRLPRCTRAVRVRTLPSVHVLVAEFASAVRVRTSAGHANSAQKPRTRRVVGGGAPDH